MTNTSGLKKKQQRLNVSINAEAANKLLQLKGEIAKYLGFEPSVTQVVEFLITTYKEKSK